MTGLGDTQVYLDDGSGTFPYNITLKCLLADGFSFSRGREDWQGGVTAGQLSLTLNNSDGRFTPGSTILGTPSPIKVDAKIRLKETVNGTTFTRFTGYVKSWPVAWPATVSTFATVRLTATDAQARAERWVLLSNVQQEILADAPVAHYALGEPSGAVSAADSSGNQTPQLQIVGASGSDPTFGTALGIPADGGTAAQFSGGQKYLTSSRFDIAAGAVECWFRFTSNANLQPIVGLDDSQDASSTVWLEMTNATLGVWKPGTGVVNIATLTDGSLHHLVLTAAPGTTRIYLDGALVLDDAGISSAIGVLTVGGHGGISPPVSLLGSVSHVAVYSSALSAARIASHYAVGSAAVEAGTARLTRLAGYAGLTVGTLDTSLTNVPFVDITNASAWDAIQGVADGEMGLAFCDGSGSLTFHNRNKVAAKSSPDLTLDKQWLDPADVQPVTDDQQMLNYFEATATATEVMQTVRNTASETSHGRYSGSAAYLVQTDIEALDRGNWTVTNFAEPTTRYGTLTINLYGMTASQQQTVLAALELNCWLRVTSMPSQNTGGTTADVVVEGFTEEQNADSWVIRCNVVSRSLFNALILDNSAYGVLDSAAARLYV